MADELVLMYHSVEPYTSDPFRVTVRPERFGRQMRWLRRNGLRGVSMRDLLSAREAGTGAHDAGTGARLVGLTFDDGYADFATYVAPILARCGFTATVFVLAGLLSGHNAWDQPGPRKELLTADDVRRVADSGMEIASHGLHHLALPDLDEATLAEEVGRSRETLTRLVGQDVTGFCYPYGKVGTREVNAVRAAGYSYACAVHPSTLDARYAIRRTYVGDRDGAARLYAKWLRHRMSGGAR